ncbi:MAG: hypothetical protein JXA61_08095 [Bacteroidales bacterium]|nr:hypothetical protein [Bacteroidales bacterium]
MMKAGSRTILTLVFFIFALPLLQGQNYIGMHKDDIENVLRRDHPHFRADLSTVNNTFKYLKFVDDVSEQTILFFLSDGDVCTYVRWISDYANLNDMIGMLDGNYKKIGEKRWTYSQDGRHYAVKLEEEDWYFTISIREE